MRSKNEYRYKIKSLADYLNVSVYQLTLGYIDYSQMQKASLKDLKLVWQFLLETCKSKIEVMDNEEWLV